MLRLSFLGCIFIAIHTFPLSMGCLTFVIQSACPATHGHAVLAALAKRLGSGSAQRYAMDVVLMFPPHLPIRANQLTAAHSPHTLRANLAAASVSL
jgi:hypothetical protein